MSSNIGTVVNHGGEWWTVVITAYGWVSILLSALAAFEQKHCISLHVFTVCIYYIYIYIHRMCIYIYMSLERYYEFGYNSRIAMAPCARGLWRWVWRWAWPWVWCPQMTWRRSGQRFRDLMEWPYQHGPTASPRQPESFANSMGRTRQNWAALMTYFEVICLGFIRPFPTRWLTMYSDIECWVFPYEHLSNI